MTPKVTLNQAHEAFVDHLKAKSRSTSTILAYGKDIEQLIETASKNGSLNPDQLKTEDIEAFKAELSNCRSLLIFFSHYRGFSEIATEGGDSLKETRHEVGVHAFVNKRIIYAKTSISFED